MHNLFYERANKSIRITKTPSRETRQALLLWGTAPLSVPPITVHKHPRSLFFADESEVIEERDGQRRRAEQSSSSPISELKYDGCRKWEVFNDFLTVHQKSTTQIQNGKLKNSFIKFKKMSSMWEEASRMKYIVRSDAKVWFSFFSGRV